MARSTNVALTLVEVQGATTSGASRPTLVESTELTSGASRRGKTRRQRCTVRKTLKLTPAQDRMLDELAEAAGIPGCALLKRLLLRAYHERGGRP